VLVSTTSTGRLFHREGAATQNARLASSVRVLGTIRRGVLELEGRSKHQHSAHQQRGNNESNKLSRLTGYQLQLTLTL